MIPAGRVRSFGTWLLESRVAVMVGGAYLAAVIVALSLPYLTGEALSGLWAYLLSMPWSELLPVETLHRFDPGPRDVVGAASVFAGGTLNAFLLCLGIRWMESSVIGGSIAEASRGRWLRVVPLGIATVAAAPMLVVGAWQVNLLVGLLVSEGPGALAGYGTVGSVVVASLGGTAGLVGLWVTVLGSPDGWTRRRLGMVTLALALGLGTCGYLLSILAGVLPEMGSWTVVYWGIVLLVPPAVALSEIVGLMRAWSGAARPV